MLLGLFATLSRKTGINAWILRIIAVVVACRIGFIPAALLYVLGVAITPS